MPALIVGTYDASTYVDLDYSTYPQLPPGVQFYQLGMGWEITVAGTVAGHPVQVGDAVFAVPLPRRYGEFTYGGKVFGSHDTEEPDWLVDEITFVPWDGSGLPPDLGPYPNAGCPFTPAHGFGGEWAPGWRIVVDVWIDADAGRTYGELAYGDEIYGGVMSRPRWRDITEPTFHVEIGDGMAEGGPRVSVSELVIAFVDPVGRWFDIATPRTWRQPQPGTAIRVGLMDPQFHYHPLITGEIERIEDVHDGEGVREVSVRGFGRTADLGGRSAPVSPPGRGGHHPVQLVQECRRVALGRRPDQLPELGRHLADRRQGPGRRAGPREDGSHRPVGRLVHGLDPRGPHPGAGMADAAAGRGHRGGRLLRLPRHAGVPFDGVRQRREPATQLRGDHEHRGPDRAAGAGRARGGAGDPFGPRARFGRRGRAFGFPMTGLAWADGAYPNVWGRRALDRYAYITRQCESFEIDTAVDQGWLSTLVDLDTSRAVVIHRTGFTDLRLDGVITGWRWRLDPGRWQGTVFVSTITPSM